LKGDVYENLQRRSVQELRVGALTASEQQEIVEKTLWEYRKKLTAAQMQQLLQKSDAYKPLYLVVACEELRVFGVFEKLSERIQEMAQTVPNLFAEVLQRLEGDHSKELIADTMSLLASSRGGLLEEEVLHLLGPSMDYPLPQSAWSRIYRSLRAYLRPVSESGEGVLDFFHQQLPKAVRRRYLADKDFERSIHAKLAAFFQMTGDPDGDKSWSAGNRRGLGFSPYHQINAEKWVDLSHALCNLAFIEAKCEAGMTFDLVADYLVRPHLVLFFLIL
jgi:telomerase protein component 1